MLKVFFGQNELGSLELKVFLVKGTTAAAFVPWSLGTGFEIFQRVDVLDIKELSLCHELVWHPILRWSTGGPVGMPDFLLIVVGLARSLKRPCLLIPESCESCFWHSLQKAQERSGSPQHEKRIHKRFRWGVPCFQIHWFCSLITAQIS